MDIQIRLNIMFHRMFNMKVTVYSRSRVHLFSKQSLLLQVDINQT